MNYQTEEEMGLDLAVTVGLCGMGLIWLFSACLCCLVSPRKGVESVVAEPNAEPYVFDFGAEGSLPRAEGEKKTEVQQSPSNLVISNL